MSIILTNGTTLDTRPERKEAVQVEEYAIPAKVGGVRFTYWAKGDEQYRGTFTSQEARQVAAALIDAAERAEVAIGRSDSLGHEVGGTIWTCGCGECRNLRFDAEMDS